MFNSVLMGARKIKGHRRPKGKYGPHIRAARQRAGLNRSELARKIGVTPAAVSGWELGAPGPLLGNLEKIAKVTNTPLSVLLGE
jgi:transcriptional regulator with XRE-family HTH domain